MPRQGVLSGGGALRFPPRLFPSPYSSSIKFRQSLGNSVPLCNGQREVGRKASHTGDSWCPLIQVGLLVPQARVDLKPFDLSWRVCDMVTLASRYIPLNCAEFLCGETPVGPTLEKPGSLPLEACRTLLQVSVPWDTGGSGAPGGGRRASALSQVDIAF